VETAEEMLHRQGVRITQPRLAVLKVLMEAEDWLSPDAIHRRGRHLCPSLGIVTVYRALALFENLGLARRIHSMDGCHGYAHQSLEHGHHVVCRTCQQAVEIPGSENLTRFFDQIAVQTGFKIEDHVLELMGLCPACQASHDRLPPGPANRETPR
jgi:Fe2+ or Zn2+ uptake regulation protein